MVVWLLVLFIFVAIVRPTHRWPELDGFPLFDLYLLTLLFLPLLMFRVFWNSDAKLFRGNILLLGMLLYSFAIVISQWFSPFVVLFEPPAPNIWFRFMVFLVFFVLSVRTERDLKIIVTAVPIFCFFVLTLDLWHFLQGNVRVGSPTMRERLGSAGNITGINVYAAWIGAMLPLIAPLLTLCKRYWHYLFVLGYVLLSIRLITLTGSRAGLVLLVGLGVLFLLFSRYRFRWISIILLAIPIGWFTLSESQQLRYRTMWDPTIAVGETASNERRGEDLIRGFRILSEYPLFGTGAGSGQEMGGGSISHHNLIGQVAGELGTFGFLAFLFMLVSFGINHYNIWRNYKYLQEKNLGKEGLYCWRVSMAAMYGVAALLLGGLGFGQAYVTMWSYFAAFQIVAVQIMQEKVATAMEGKLLPGLPTMPSRQ